MPIIDLQRRLREIGRIRIGEQRVSQKSGKKYPAKLTTFRLTSQDGSVISQAAEVFGGDAKRWTDAPAGEQYEVITEASSLDVIVPPTGMAFSQFYELWSGGGCQRRCDGRRELISDSECLCDPGDRECKPHTRLSVILRDLPGLGVWRLDTQGYYAAVELSGVVEVCQQAAERGQMLPARLRLEQREVKRPNQPTMAFAVPVLDVDVNFGALLLGRGADPTPIDGAAHRGLTAVDQAALPPAPEVPVASQVSAVNEPKERKPRKNAQSPMPATGRRPRTAAEAAVPSPEEQKAHVAQARQEVLTPDQQVVQTTLDGIGAIGLRKAIGEKWRATFAGKKVVDLNDAECDTALELIGEELIKWNEPKPPAKSPVERVKDYIAEDPERPFDFDESGGDAA